MTEHKGLPVHGYQPQSDDKVALVNGFKQDEERLLRKLDALLTTKLEGDKVVPSYDARWLSIARTHFQEGFMALNRAIFQPQRIELPEDEGYRMTSYGRRPDGSLGPLTMDEYATILKP